MESSMQASTHNIQTGLSAYGYVKLAIRTVVASVLATFLIVFFVPGVLGNTPIGWLIFLNPEFQITFLYVLGIMFISNLLAALAISV